MIGSTRLQGRALAAIQRLTVDGVAPSYAELADELNMVVSSVHRVLHSLRERGLIEMMPNRARTVRVIGAMEGLEQQSDEDLRALRRNIDLILMGRAQ